MPRTLRFNILDQLVLELDTCGHAGYERYFRNEYARIATEGESQAGTPRIKIEIVKQLPEPLPQDLTRRVLFKRLFSYAYTVRNLESDVVEIYFKRHWVDRIYMNAIGVFLQAHILEPVMYYKLLGAGILLMHAGGVGNADAAYLFPAEGGTGKTTLSIALLEQGYSLLGDDLVLVDANSGIAYPYPRPLHLFAYNIQALGQARVPIKYRFAIRLKNVLRFVLERTLRTEFLISTRVHAHEMFANDPYGEARPCRGVYFLVREGPSLAPLSLEGVGREEAVERIKDSADLNESLYELLGDPTSVEAVERQERKVIGKFLSRFPVMDLVNPRELAPRALARHLERGRSDLDSQASEVK